MNKLLIALFLIFTLGCEEKKFTHIDSSIGTLPFSYYNCIAGLVVTNDGVNLRDKHSNIVTCNGYIHLTIKEHNEIKRAESEQ